MNEEENRTHLQKDNEVKFLSHLLGTTEGVVEGATSFSIDLFEEEQIQIENLEKNKTTSRENSVKKSIKKKSITEAINNVIFKNNLISTS